jgi:hypothetical protein
MIMVLEGVIAESETVRTRWVDYKNVEYEP